MKPRALYIHVPFCARRCSYCDFAVEAMREPPIADWLDAIARELAMQAETFGWADPLELDTLYIGGGTPSLLGATAMSELIDRLSPHLRLASDAEWTCEANPESFTADVARGWWEAGVNRISLGAQTFHEPALRWMGRLHGADGPGKALSIARDAGFENVSIDLIFGLPARLGRDWSADLERTVALAPEHISLYGLTAESGAPLGRWVAEGRETLADEDRYAEEYLLAHQVLTTKGFEHYEVSNFGRDGLRSRHNSVYWSGAAYGALGPGAHAFHPPERRWNLRSWSAYREAITRGRLPVDATETVDAESARLERVWLALRTREGLSVRELHDDQSTLVERWIERGLAEQTADRIRLTPNGWLLLDEIAVSLSADDPDALQPPDGRRFDATPDLVQIDADPNAVRR